MRDKFYLNINTGGESIDKNLFQISKVMEY
jgi:hypothetical protein